ncbi:unnamed protein product [Gongylonema pulchrum]|uniref:Mediator of RNA polymerase II transcription subunit 21 n=1 Tax=Gongylonema pulchrum TaxID=637853 RepID=A0A183E4J2_9BILA|nr:unnamed protein product [Gongylonema pulchrum]
MCCSRRAISKLVQVFDHITQRNAKIAELVASCPASQEASTNDGASTSDEKPAVLAQEDMLARMDIQKQEMDNRLEEVKYELEKVLRRECKLDVRLAEVCLHVFVATNDLRFYEYVCFG